MTTNTTKRNPTIGELNEAIEENRERLASVRDLRDLIRSNRLPEAQKVREHAKLKNEYPTLDGREIVADLDFLTGQLSSIGEYLQKKHRAAVADEERRNNHDPAPRLAAVQLEVDRRILSLEEARRRLAHELYVQERRGVEDELRRVEAALASARVEHERLDLALQAADEDNERKE